MLHRHAQKANVLWAILQSLFPLRTRKLTIKTNVTRHTCILVGYTGTLVEEESSFLLLQLCTLACETLSSSKLAAAHGVFLTAPQNSPLATKSHGTHMGDSFLPQGPFFSTSRKSHHDHASRHFPAQHNRFCLDGGATSLLNRL